MAQPQTLTAPERATETFRSWFPVGEDPLTGTRRSASLTSLCQVILGPFFTMERQQLDNCAQAAWKRMKEELGDDLRPYWHLLSNVGLRNPQLFDAESSKSVSQMMVKLSHLASEFVPHVWPIATQHAAHWVLLTLGSWPLRTCVGRLNLMEQRAVMSMAALVMERIFSTRLAPYQTENVAELAFGAPDDRAILRFIELDQPSTQTPWDLRVNPSSENPRGSAWVDTFRLEYNLVSSSTVKFPYPHDGLERMFDMQRPLRQCCFARGSETLMEAMEPLEELSLALHSVFASLNSGLWDVTDLVVADASLGTSVPLLPGVVATVAKVDAEGVYAWLPCARYRNVRDTAASLLQVLGVASWMEDLLVCTPHAIDLLESVAREVAHVQLRTWSKRASSSDKRMRVMMQTMPVVANEALTLPVSEVRVSGSRVQLRVSSVDGAVSAVL